MVKHRGILIRVVDGDTFVILINLGYDTYKECRVRLMGINTPEIRGPGKEKGFISKEFVEQFLYDDVVLISEEKKDRYGRWLGWVEVNDGEDLTEMLLENGLGEVYPKKKNLFLRLFSN